MPAPKMLGGLPKPILFGLYGATGGLLGALVFAELLYHLLTPSPRRLEAQLAIVASKEVEVFVDGRNTFPVQIARARFDGPITIHLEGLPPGVTADPVIIPAGKSEGEVLVIGSSLAQLVAAQSATAVAEAAPSGQTITAETSIRFRVTNPPKPLADIVFVLDVTNSMQWAIDELKNGIGKFADSLLKSRVDLRLGLVTFQDISYPGEKVEVIEFKGGPFTADAATYRDEVAKLKAAGGGDIPESSLEGVAAACQLPFRKNATKILLLITDAPPKVLMVNNTAKAVRDCADQVRNVNIDAVHVVGLRFDKDVYSPLLAAGTDKAGGTYFDLKEVVIGDEGFDGVLANFGSVVTTAAIAKNPDTKPQVASSIDEAATLSVKSLQSGEQSAAGTEGKLVLRSAVWTAAIAALVCLFLLGGQHHYLRGTLPRIGSATVGILGGLAVGLVGGAAGQGLFFLAPDIVVLAHIFRVFAWALLGGMAGAGLSLFIPNMKWTLGLAGGAIGGAAGAIGFIAVSSATGDLVGRLVGGLVLGFCIGLMVAIAETAFRRAWLEVHFGGGEKITVTLGPEPVKVGSDVKVCTVWARGAAALVLRFFVRDGKVICDDVVQGRETTVGNGFAREVGTLSVIVRTGGGTPTPLSPPSSTPAPTSKPTAMPVEDADAYAWSMPVASRPPEPPAPPPRPVTPVVATPKQSAPPAPPPLPVKPTPPRPVAPAVATPKQSAPPAPPRPTSPSHQATPQTSQPISKNPDTCPGCHRVVSGKPGQRFCMVCEVTF